MRVRPHELPAHIQRHGLAPIYLVSGDEPLQINEATDAIRAIARTQDYRGRDILDASAKFDWNELTAEANNLSLFAEKRILDLRIPSGKPGREGSKALTDYAARPAEDTVLLITLPKLDKAQLSSKWLKALEVKGVLIQIWPIEGSRLQPWIEQRMRQAGLIPGPQVAALLTERIEGNLLAAAQEIDKLQLLFGAGVISLEQLQESVADSARYDIYGLVDSALAGGIGRSIRMLNGLRAEGTAAPVILWALTREIRLICSLAQQVEGGRSPQQVVAAAREVWDKRKPLVTQGLQRLNTSQWQKLLQLCCLTDRAIKGQDPQDPWLQMQRICTRMAGAPLLDG
ncbi:MAG: DNA polymerase III subunit delta [Sedimenticola sp.]|nr:DNA polymerase III subunit delta [Sedimenticola sp.]MCW8949232.1 DNA polymerase III subunit delta [Sedimenticola sp.]